MQTIVFHSILSNYNFDITEMVKQMATIVSKVNRKATVMVKISLIRHRFCKYQDQNVDLFEIINYHYRFGILGLKMRIALRTIQVNKMVILMIPVLLIHSQERQW